MTLNAADSNLGRIAYEREVAFNVKNSPFNAQIARITSSSLAANKETQISDELRSDRMVGDLVETAFTSGGDFGFELSLGGGWDDLLESLLAGTKSNAILFVGDLQVAAATQTISDPGLGGTAFASAVPGQYVLIEGFTAAGNNGWHRIVTVPNADSITVATDVADLTDETTASGAAKATSSIIRNPGDAANIVKRSYNIEQYFSDIDIAQLFLGQRLGTMALTVAANAIVNGTMTFMGASMQVQEASGPFPDSTTPPGTEDVVSATSNVAGVEIAGAKADCLVQSVDLSIDNGLRNQNAVGSKFPCNIGYGRQVVSGTVTLYFQDLNTYNAFLNHTDSSLEFGFIDNAGNGMHFYIPRLKWATDTPSLEGIDTDVLENLDYQAIAFDPGGGQDPYQIQISIATPA